MENNKNSKGQPAPLKPAEWQMWTWQEYYDDCSKFAKTLIHLNIGMFQVVNIIGFNSPEWFIANTGSILAGCIAAGIYTTNNPDACEYQVKHSQSQLVIVEDNSQLKKFADKATGLPLLQHIVIWMEQPDAALVAKLGKIKVHFWTDFLALGCGIPDNSVEDRASKVRPGNCSTLIYTSGTTGMPKAVMISHDNVAWTTGIMCDSYFSMGAADRVASYLPLSHIAAQLIDLHVPMNLGCCTYFCQPYDMKLGTLTATLTDVEPTFFFGVPRVWEKIQEKMVGMGRDNSAVLKAISSWAKMLGTKHSATQQFGGERIGPANFFYTLVVAAMIVYTGIYIFREVLEKGAVPALTFVTKNPTLTMAYWVVLCLAAFVYVVFHEGYPLANKIVFQTIKKKLGLLKSKANFTAAAPISVDTLNYFASLDIPIYEVFGQSECTGPHTVSAPGQWKVGTCGRPLPGTFSKVVPDTKELAYRGRHVFMGYMYDIEKTTETIDSEGFLHSGDVGEFDDDEAPKTVLGGPSGFMRITGRIKELIIGAGGENIPPVLIENDMKAEMVALSNAMVIGDKRKYLTMLVSLKCDPDKESGAPSDCLAKDALFVADKIGSTAKTVTEALRCKKFEEYINKGMKAVNARAISNAQNVQKWKLLPVDFSEKAGELTPTLKLKRNVVTAKYAKEIEELYAE